MGIFGTLLPTLLLAMLASAQVDHHEIHDIGITRRSTSDDFHGFLPGIKLGQHSENLPLPRLLRRENGCPSFAPNICSYDFCGQTCCDAAGGDYCLYDEYCLSDPPGCCKNGGLCWAPGSRSTRNNYPLKTLTTSSAAPTPTRSRQELKGLVLDALEKVPDIDLFTALVKAQPDLFELLNPALDYTILAPDNAAVKADPGVGVGGGSGAVSPQLALSFVERGSADPPLTAGPRTLKTTLKDQKYVNLGKGEPARIVSSVLGENLTIAAGMGKSVIFGGKDNPFGGGTINVGKEFFTLPEDLSTTLRGTDGAEFEKFLDGSSKLGALSDSKHITIFALTDTAFASVGNRLTKDTLQQNILQGAAWYTPDSVDGKSYHTAAGGKIEVTTEGDDQFVNGVKIVKSDAIMKNGVVHYVEDIIPHVAATSIAGRPSISPFITIVVIVAALIRYNLKA